MDVLATPWQPVLPPRAATPKAREIPLRPSVSATNKLKLGMPSSHCWPKFPSQLAFSGEFYPYQLLRTTRQDYVSHWWCDVMSVSRLHPLICSCLSFEVVPMSIVTLLCLVCSGRHPQFNHGPDGDFCPTGMLHVLDSLVDSTLLHSLCIMMCPN